MFGGDMGFGQDGLLDGVLKQHYGMFSASKLTFLNLFSVTVRLLSFLKVL